MYIVTIPDYVPTSLNRIMGTHWRGRSNLKGKDYRAIITACTLARVPLVAVPKGQKEDRRKAGITDPLPGDPEPQRRRLEILIVWPRGSRQYDKDNVRKVLQDGLVHGGFLVDDSPRWLEVREPDYERSRLSEGSTTLTLTDLGPPVNLRAPRAKPAPPARRIWFPQD